MIVPYEVQFSEFTENVDQRTLIEHGANVNYYAFSTDIDDINKIFRCPIAVPIFLNTIPICTACVYQFGGNGVIYILPI